MLQTSISALFVIPSISPSHPSLLSTSAQGCQSFRDPVSCEIAQIAVALRLAQQQRGESERERERKREREILCFNTSEPESAPLPHCPFLPLFTQTWTSTRTAARPHIYPLQSKYLPPTHNSELSHPPPPSPPDFSPCHPYGKDTSTTLLQCAGHFTQQLDESLQPSRGIKPLLSLWRTASVTSTKKSKAPHTTHTMPPGTPFETWQILSKGHKHVVTVFTTLMICVFFCSHIPAK